MGLDSPGSRAVRRCHCVGGGAPVNLVGDRQKMFVQRFPKNFVLSSTFSDDHFLVIENCNKKSTQQEWHRWRADKLSAAARQSTKVSGDAHKLLAAVAAVRCGAAGARLYLVLADVANWVSYITS